MVLDTLIKVKKEIVMGTPTPSLPKAMAILAQGIMMGNSLKHRLDAEMRVPVSRKLKSGRSSSGSELLLISSQQTAKLRCRSYPPLPAER
ncbi:hypothetical protein ACFX12_012762 [Malus domestica]